MKKTVSLVLALACVSALMFTSCGKKKVTLKVWESDGPEGTILYHSENNKLIASSIIHEFLHLFGAIDLYETDVQTADNSARMEKMYPKEVMHNHYFPLTELVISPLTAWLVGLSDNKESWFETFLPK